MIAENNHAMSYAEIKWWGFIKPMNWLHVVDILEIIVYVYIFAASTMTYHENLPWVVSRFLLRTVIDYEIRIRLYKLATPTILSVMSIVFAKRRLGVCV